MAETNKGKVTVKGCFDIPIDRLDGVLQGFHTHVALTREEPGNEMFEFHFDDQIEGRVHVSECYRDRAAVDAHYARIATTTWAETRKLVVSQVTIENE